MASAWTTCRRSSAAARSHHLGYRGDAVIGGEGVEGLLRRAESRVRTGVVGGSCHCRCPARRNSSGGEAGLSYRVGCALGCLSGWDRSVRSSGPAVERVAAQVSNQAASRASRSVRSARNRGSSAVAAPKARRRDDRLRQEQQRAARETRRVDQIQQFLTVQPPPKIAIQASSSFPT